MGNAARRKGIILILDGLGDRPSAKLDGRTPLEAASTPFFDELASRGLVGLVDPLLPGVPVGTHTGTGVLMGLSPRDASSLSRGPVEAAGVGAKLRNGEIAIRCNFATLEDNDGQLTVVDRRAGRINEGTAELARAVSEIDPGDGLHVTLHPAVQHRGVLMLGGGRLNSQISDTDPGDEVARAPIRECRPTLGDHPGAERAARALNRVIRESYHRLHDHPVNQRRIDAGLKPANGIITRGAGRLGSLDNVIGHLAVRTAVVTGGSAIAGLGRLFGFTVISDPSFTADRHTNLELKVARAMEALEDHDLVFLSIKAPDICAHDLDPEGKRDILERVDMAIQPLLSLGLVIGVTGDHSTNSNSGIHTGDPVPTLLASPDGRRDRVAQFGEIDCTCGGLGRISASSFLASVLDAMGRMHSYEPGQDRWFSPCGSTQRD